MLSSLSGNSSCMEAMWFLVGRLPDQQSARQIPIHTMPFQVGRRADVSLSLPCSTVSSLHAQFVDQGERIVLCDLGSTNGTFVNGKRLKDRVELQVDDLVQFASIPFRLMRQSAATHPETVSEDVLDHAMSLVQFDQLMSDRAVIPYYQPIVRLRECTLFGYEVLARSPIVGLESPAAMFSAAAELNLQTKLSQMVRWKSIEQTMAVHEGPHLFLNTHPAELAETELLDSMGDLRKVSTRQAMTLEIHESAVTDSGEIRRLRAALRDLEVGLAFDDFGAGQARLIELAEVQPDYLKFDMSLIRRIDQATEEKVQMVGALVTMVRDMGIVPLAEGIENEGERNICEQLDFELAQGYLFGKPVAI